MQVFLVKVDENQQAPLKDPWHIPVGPSLEQDPKRSKKWHWVGVFYQKIWILAFFGKYSNIVCWVSKHVDWGSHQNYTPENPSTSPISRIFTPWVPNNGKACRALWKPLPLKFQFLSWNTFVLCSFTSADYNQRNGRGLQ